MKVFFTCSITLFALYFKIPCMSDLFNGISLIFQWWVFNTKFYHIFRRFSVVFYTLFIIQDFQSSRLLRILNGKKRKKHTRRGHGLITVKNFTIFTNTATVCNILPSFHHIFAQFSIQFTAQYYTTFKVLIAGVHAQVSCNVGFLKNYLHLELSELISMTFLCFFTLLKEPVGSH